MSRFVDTLIATAASSGQHRGITTGEPNEPVRRTWAEVHEQARRVAGALVVGGLRPGASVGVLAAAPALIAPVAQGVWLAGGNVTMLHQPTPRSDLEEWAEDTVRVLRMIGSDRVLLGNPFDQLASVLEQNDITFQMIDDLFEAEPIGDAVASAEDDLALLQLTSGSTADPKAVKITHSNLYSNMTAMMERSHFDPATNTMASWLPLFHDMGMVGLLTLPMTFGVELVKVTPADFLSSPLLWPDLISRYRATMTAAPNFAYAITGKRMARVDADDAYDLSSLRIVLNGAEPVDEESMRTFMEAGARFGLDRSTVFPAYGLAESTLAVSFSHVGSGLHMDVVEAHPLEAENRAVPVPEGDPRRGSEEARSFAILGPPLPGLEVVVVDENGTELAEREVGEIKVRGEAVTPGYLTVDGPTPALDAEGWFPTGDLGYLVDDEIVICGRSKDVIIMGGRNIYPTDIERAASAVDGVRAGNAAAVRLDAGTRRERFAVVLESKQAGDEQAEREIAKEVTRRVVDAVEFRPFSVVVLPPGSLLKTPSGKVRRAATASEYAEQITKHGHV
ncbi:fatty acyl-AMP ligase [Haloechinothrix sp. LS1_15]|uniref:fatty acyl-AMP ligase n=1 Tax=Haloechinothrix sp. LS1_15 TaxID=2652248 RepID=UPI002946BCB2|nr:fatty acyl-AMP ligase [Haloechinothrix sp. LS1_15]MDV6011481.1 fatty acyl-AMP ligase [Haloechinothrix sp. LS1_15]